MSQLLERCQKCVDSMYIDWEKVRISSAEKREKEEFIVWGVLHLALYVLPNDEYFKFKEYLWNKHGYDCEGTRDGQISIYDYIVKKIEKGGPKNESPGTD